jgi:phosphatidylinositol-3-phosphatase
MNSGVRYAIASLLLVASAAAQPGSLAEPAAAVVTAKPTKVLTIFVENHTYSQMRAGMPYLNSQAQKYGYATNWSSITKPSLPNYLAIAGGTTYEITDDAYPDKHLIKGDSVFSQATRVGKTAKTYAESMPSNCYQTNSGLYAVRHNPWPYFVDGRIACKNGDVPQNQLAGDVASNSLPNVGMLIPNMCNISHTGGCPLANAGSLSLADNYLKKQLPPMLASADFTSGKLTIVVTADEGSTSDKKVLTVVLNAALSGKVVTSALTHYSLNRYYDQVLGVPPLRKGATAPDMRAAFGL